MFSYYRVNEKCIGKPSEAESTPKYKKKNVLWLQVCMAGLSCFLCSKKIIFMLVDIFLSVSAWILSELILWTCSRARARARVRVRVCVCVCVFYVYLQHVPLQSNTTCSSVHLILWLYFWLVVSIDTHGSVFFFVVLYTVFTTGRNIIN